VQGREDDVPVSDAWIEISAVSRSRVSPQDLVRVWRRIARRQAAKVTPISLLIGTWISRRCRTRPLLVVMILSAILFSSFKVA